MNSVGTHSSLAVLLVAVVLQVMQWMDAGLTPDCQYHAHDAVHGSGTVVTESSSCHSLSVSVSRTVLSLRRPRGCHGIDNWQCDFFNSASLHVFFC